MSEKCQRCGEQYETVYRVPNEVWAKIAPQKESLGPHAEHQFGGLLCIKCADLVARDQGITLYWDSHQGDWPDNKAKEFLDMVCDLTHPETREHDPVDAFINVWRKQGGQITELEARNRDLETALHSLSPVLCLLFEGTDIKPAELTGGELTTAVAAAVERLRVDAERYQWLKQREAFSRRGNEYQITVIAQFDGQGLDTAIDAAREATDE